MRNLIDKRETMHIFKLTNNKGVLDCYQVEDSTAAPGHSGRVAFRTPILAQARDMAQNPENYKSYRVHYPKAA